MYGNLMYFSMLNIIGGIETWYYYLSELYKDLDITVVIRRGADFQTKRLSKNIRVIKWDGKQRFECEHLFLCFNTDIIPFVKAKKISLVLHGDYEDMVKRGQLVYSNLPINSKVDEYIGITQLVCDSWERLTGIKARLCYNPVLKPREHKIIRLCSAQRMTAEKGRDRIKLLAQTLDRLCEVSGDTWLWDIYTDDTNVIYNKSISYKRPRLDITEYFKAYDWFVALSDNEGYCYSVVENLIRGVPCVTTDLPVFRELNLNGTNSLTLKMDLSNIFQIATDMFEKKLVFKYEPPKDNWRFLFEDIKSTYRYKEEVVMRIKVRALDTYQKLKIKDAVIDEVIPAGFEFEVDEERLKVLLGNNSYKVAFVEVIDEKPMVAEEKPIVEEEKPIEVKEQIEVKKHKRKKK